MTTLVKQINIYLHVFFTPLSSLYQIAPNWCNKWGGNPDKDSCTFAQCFMLICFFENWEREKHPKPTVTRLTAHHACQLSRWTHKHPTRFSLFGTTQRILDWSVALLTGDWHAARPGGKAPHALECIFVTLPRRLIVWYYSNGDLYIHKKKTFLYLQNTKIMCILLQNLLDLFGEIIFLYLVIFIFKKQF